MSLRGALDAVVSVLLPAPCRICGRTLATASAIPICTSCFASIEPIVEPMCQCCGRPFEVAPQSQMPASSQLCRLCRSNLYAFDRARCFAQYNDALSGAILLLKYEEVTRLGTWFAEKLANLFSSAGDDAPLDLIVPVPLHPDRRRERGYNQAELIARPLARRLGLRLDAKLLVRAKPRPAQLVLSRSEHWKSVRGAYATRPGVRVDNLRILLVDDVMTTGATLDACSRVLKKAGASSVFGVAVARVAPGRSLVGAKVKRIESKAL